MKNVIKTSTKIVLVPLGLPAAASVTDTAIQKQIFGITTQIASNEEMDNIMKKVKSHEESCLLIKKVEFLACY